MKHQLLNNLSGALVLIVVTVVFSLLFESRYSKKTYLKSLIPFITVLLGVNFYVIFRFGFSEYAQFTFLLATLPSLIYFYIVAKYRGGKFFFTFCLVDTSSIWFVLTFAILDMAVGGEGLLNCIIRALIAPLIIWATSRFFRQAFLSLLHTVNKGWWLFTAATGVVYILLLVMAGYPVSLRDRPDDVPLAILICCFLPIVYATIFYVLFAQQRLHQVKSFQNVFSAQCAMMEARTDEMRTAEEKIRIERHDMRHKLNIIEELARKNEADEILNYLGSITHSLDETSITHYCENPVLDAILSSYLRKAAELGIPVETRLHIPEQLPVSAAELATVFANIIENAIHANCALPPEKRRLTCVCISEPTLMFEVKNPYHGTVNFDQNGLPVSADHEHGTGAKSIAAFCKKYNAEYSCTAENGQFSMMVGL